jgi:hypothetical protein
MERESRIKIIGAYNIKCDGPISSIFRKVISTKFPLSVPAPIGVFF